MTTTLRAVAVIAKAHVTRFLRNRSFFVLGIAAPFALMAALSVTIGSALGSLYVPELAIADELADGTVDGLVDGLAATGFSDLTIVSSEAEARGLVEDGTIEAAIVFPRTIASADAGSIQVLAHADADANIATAVAESIAEQTTRQIDAARLLGSIGLPPADLSTAGDISRIEIVDEAAGLRVLADETYFAVAMAAYFTLFVATALTATFHEDRRHFTLARMLGAPIGRLTPVLAIAAAVMVLCAVALTILVISSTLLLDADWGPVAGVIVTGLAICIASVGVGVGIASLTRTEQAASQVGAALATAWAITGGVFLTIPPTGIINTVSKFSPFRWALKGIAINAAGGAQSEVVTHAAVVAVFGLIGAAIAFARRRQLLRVT